MATDAAIAATSEAIRRCLERALPGSGLPSTPAVELYGTDDLQKPVTDGAQAFVAVYLHRVVVSSVRMTGGPRLAPDGTRKKPGIPVDLHYLITALASDPLVQQRLVGWAIRVLDETPVLPAALLNSHEIGSTVFAPGDTVELSWEALSRQDLSDVWESAKSNQQPAATYVARAVLIDSRVTLEEHPPVQARRFEYAGQAPDPTGPPA